MMIINKSEYLKKIVPGEKLHVFICFNLMPNSYLNEIIKKKEIHDKFIVIEFYSREIINCIEQERVFRFLYGKSKFKYFIELLRAKSLINRIFSSYANVDFYFSHPMHILSNYIFFSSLSNINFYMIPDGIANYYEVNTYRYIKKMIIKKIISFFVGIKYKIYKDHITGYNVGNYIGAYSLSCDFFLFDKKPELISSKKIFTIKEENKNKILILGQPSSGGMFYINYIEKIVSSFKNNEFFYKPHPAENLSKQFIKWLCVNHIEIIRTNSSAEDLAGEFYVFVSSVSSGLFSIKLIYGSNVVCISFVQKNMMEELFSITGKDLVMIKNKFLSVGVEVNEF